MFVAVSLLGCGGVATYTVGGQEMTPEEYRAELKALYGEYQEASQAYSEGPELDMDAYDRVSETVEELEELGFVPVEYSGTGRPIRIPDDRIEDVLQSDDESLETWMKTVVKIERVTGE